MQKANSKKHIRKPQSQEKSGNEYLMQPSPVLENLSMRPALKLANKVAFITGGDSGTGRAVSVLFAKEGYGSDTPMKRAGEPAEVAPSYLFQA
ncbi:MAG: hypothetical protein ABJA57_02960 [Ginsengibacter sp.]